MKALEIKSLSRSALVLFLVFFVKPSEANTFRVLIAFTQQAQSHSFSPHYAAMVIKGITEEVYQNSSPTYAGYQMPKVELAGTVKVTYTGTNSRQAVNALKSKTDSQMDEIHTLRELYEADLVILVHPFTNSGGEAYAVEINHENQAFAVVSAPSFLTTLTAHEIGHLVGCIHDFQDPLFVHPSVSYAYGYVAPSNAWGDVMTYHANVARWFSNPYETHNGVARGVVNKSDCTRKHHERKGTLSAYRTTPHSILDLMGDPYRHLEKNESIFWDLPGYINFAGDRNITEGLISLKAGMGISLWSLEEGLLEFKSSQAFLKSPTIVEFSGNFTEGSFAWVATDSLFFHRYEEGTKFVGSVANFMANVIRQKDGARLTIAPDTSGIIGSMIFMEARKQIRLTKRVKITGGPWGIVSLRVLKDYDPLAPGNIREHVLEKPAIEVAQTSRELVLFQSRVIQERGAVSLEYALPQKGPVSIRVFDLKGALAASLEVPDSRDGLNTISIPGSFRKGAVYFLRVTSGGKVQTHKFVSAL